MSSRGLRIRQTGLTGAEILPVHGYRDGEKDGCGLLLSQFFLVGGHSSSIRSGGTIFVVGYLIPQPFTAGGN
jgi:hypothetical protein